MGPGRGNNHVIEAYPGGVSQDCLPNWNGQSGMGEIPSRLIALFGEDKTEHQEIKLTVSHDWAEWRLIRKKLPNLA